MTFSASDPRAVPVVVGIHTCGLIQTSASAWVNVDDDHTPLFAVVTPGNRPDEATVIADRIATLLNLHGLADIEPDLSTLEGDPT